MPKRLSFMDVDCRLASKDELLDAIAHASSESPVRIATLNPEIILEARKNPRYRQALEGMEVCSVDGFGLFFMLTVWQRLHRRLIIGRYPGADLVEAIFQSDKSVFLLGGQPGMGLATDAAAALKTRYPNLRIVGAEGGGTIDRNNPQVDPELAARIREAKPDVLLVGFGAPRQELWISAARDLPVPVMVGVGGTFGFYLQKKRAPQLMRSLGLEWLYRGFSESGHWGRIWRAVVVFSLYALGWMIKASSPFGRLRA